MTIATGSRHNMAYVVESTFGTTPTTPSFTPIRHTGTTIGLSKRRNRVRRVTRRSSGSSFPSRQTESVAGDINVELSYESFDDLLEAVLCGTWATNVLKAGTTRRSYTVERHHQDIGKYLRSTGCNFNALSLSVAPNSMVTGSLSVIGKDFTIASAAITGATYAAETTTSPFDSFTGSIYRRRIKHCCYYWA